MQADHTQIWIQLIGAVVILVPVILNFIQSRKNADKTDKLAKSLVDEDGKQKIDKVTEKVVELTRNTDGMQTELLSLTARANQAEGINKGIADEQERAALISEPAQVHDAMNGKEVLKQIAAIDDHLTVVDATSTRIEEAGKAATARADKHEGAEPGVAADAAVKSPKE